jgi:hypothetical protein
MMSSPTPASAPSMANDDGSCLACGAPASSGSALCAACEAEAPGKADTLVVVPGEERAHALVPAALAPLVLSRLGPAGRDARAVSLAEAWRALPMRTWSLVIAVLVTGSWAAARLGSVLLWGLSTVVALVLVLAAERAIRTPALVARADDELETLPPRLRRAVTDALALLGAGDARRLLADLVRRARPLVAAVQRLPDERRVLDDVADLVDAACAIALQLERLDAFLALPGGAASADARRRCEGTRAQLSQRMSDAAAAVDAMHAQLLQEGTPASERITELVAELSSEAAARHAAELEVDELLGKAPSPSIAAGKPGA